MFLHVNYIGMDAVVPEVGKLIGINDVSICLW